MKNNYQKLNKELISKFEQSGVEFWDREFSLDQYDKKYINLDFLEVRTILLVKINNRFAKIIFYTYTEPKPNDEGEMINHPFSDYEGVRCRVRFLSSNDYSREYLIEQESDFGSFLNYLS
ncbi:MAG: hypothetical protein ABEJ02_01245 [Candidatus Paceibacteria bacterium]